MPGKIKTCTQDDIHGFMFKALARFLSTKIPIFSIRDAMTAKLVFNSASFSIALSSLAIVTIFNMASRAVMAIEPKILKGIDLATWLGLAATIVGTYIAITSQNEGRVDKRYEQFKEQILQNSVNLKQEVSEDLRNLYTSRDQFEARLWEDLEVARRDLKEELSEMVEKLESHDRLLRSLEVMISSHSSSFGHDGMIKLVVDTKGEVAKFRAEIQQIAAINDAIDRIENLEHLILRNAMSHIARD